MNVQFCSGGSRIPEWDNRDFECDIRSPLPYADNSVDNVRCEHGAEHQTTHQCLRFFIEVLRILKPGGKFRVCCPVLERVTPEHARDLILNHGHELAFSTQLLKDFVRAAGFVDIHEVARDEWDHHWNMIGKELDDLETARVVGTKP